ncbi:MAG: hypothetical protein C4338_03580 [Rhodanobacteraceae bacterium]
MPWAWLYPLGVAAARRRPAVATRSRAALLRQVSRALDRARRDDCGCALLRLQVTGLDALHERHGAAFVENALRVVAERLRRQMRGDDLVARSGDHEFILLAQGIDVSLQEAGNAIASRVSDSLTKPYGVDGVCFVLGLRIGIARFPGDAQDATGLLLAASQALHGARRQNEAWRFAAPLLSPSRRVIR